MEPHPPSYTLEDNPSKFDEFLRGYAPGAVVIASMSPLAVTGAAQLASWYASDGLSNELQWGFAVCWALALGSIPLLHGTRRKLVRPGPRKVPQLYWVQSAVQLTWLALLAWYVTPAFVPVLFFLLCSVLFNDARYFYFVPALKAVYLSMWVGQLALLLMIDLVGGEGLLGALHRNPGEVAVVLISELCVAALSLAIIQVVGRGHAERDQAAIENTRLQARLSAMQTQRAVLVRSCDFLLQGLSAGRFSHDVASPVSVLTVETARLRELLANHATTDPKIARCLLRIEDATELAAGLTRSLARSLREPAEPVQLELAHMVRDALRAAEVALERHAISMPRPLLAIDDTTVAVSAEHASALANVITNGVLQHPEQPLEISGVVASEHFCRLSVRDHGVPAAERQDALARVQAHMSLDVEEQGQRRVDTYDGYGIGLLLTKTLVVRWGGWMAASAPDEGAGVRVDFVFPRVPPASIPKDLNYPERVLGHDNSWERQYAKPL